MKAAPNEIPCLDIWPLKRLNAVIVRAYRNLHRMGVITITFPVRVVGEKVCFSYRAAVPHEWAKENIQEAVNQLRRGLEKAMADTETRLNDLFDPNNESQSLEFNALKQQYAEICYRLQKEAAP